MEEAILLSDDLRLFTDAVHRVCHRHEYEHTDSMPPERVVNPQHYRRLTLKQTIDAENVLLEQDKVIDFPLKPSDLSRYDEALYD